MAEYIERETAIEKIFKIGSENYTGSYAQIGIIHAAQIIKHIPAADVAPVVHAKWIKRGYVCGEREYECSACHETEWRTSCSRLKYCPFCGAKMDLED